MEEHKITTTISCNNNLDYLKLAIKSVRQNCYYKDMPFIIHAENCNDGTEEWLEENKEKYDLEIYIDHNNQPKGIGGGMDFCVNKVKTEFVNIIHADMWCAPNQDLELLKMYKGVAHPLIVSSFRIQPKVFPQDPDYRPGTVFHPIDEFGEYHHNFDSDYFDEWATEFSKMNDSIVRKAGGAGFFCRVKDYKAIGGNDPLFAPASWEDMDLFIRMQLKDYEFKMTSKSILWHFGARGSHFRDEAKDDFTKKSIRQQKSEEANMQKWVRKWGRMPDHDSETFVKPITDSKVDPVITTDIGLWMDPKEVKLMEKYIKPTDVMLEYGAGGSTTYLPKLVDKYYSIEHLEGWYLKVWSSIEKNKLLNDTHNNVSIHHINPDILRSETGATGPRSYQEFQTYIEFPKTFDTKFDKVLIDGRARPHCAIFILKYLKEDSMVFIHDFWARPQYHNVLEYYDEVESVKDTIVQTGGSMVALKPKNQTLRGL